MTSTETISTPTRSIPSTFLPAKSEDDNVASFVRSELQQDIVRQVVRQKLRKQRHLVLPKAIDAAYLDELFPQLLDLFNPQTVYYNGGIAKVPEWKISCYLEVMEGGVPTTHPNLELQAHFEPLLDACNDIFLFWYHQQHACNKVNQKPVQGCHRLMTFVTRYTPNPGEQALLKHVDGAGKVDGSVVVALPIDRWSAPESENAFEGGGITFWDGGNEIHYDTRSGDLALIDRAVWHQADPIIKGTRWALVIFYRVER
uniref:Fe2OG dioxygenase domain-containing protein n=2 Tax=Amphora coffeiformis TaxID=265554 RepID=A0A7S3PDM7_9STRA